MPITQSVEKDPELVKQRLLAEFAAAAARPDFDPRIPSPEVNYNQQPTATYREYLTEFVSLTVTRQMPELLRLARFAEQGPGFVMLDYGCGLGRLAFAFTNFFGKDPSRRYIGYEIHPKAFAFLSQAYRQYPNVSIIGDSLSVDDSYVEIHEGAGSRAGDSEPRIKAADVRLQGRIDVPLDLQFSHSVFTHMYRPPIVRVLTEVASLMKPEGICVNSWQIVDRFAESSMRCGLADRQLPYEYPDHGFLTYDRTNPLMCTAYRLEQVKAIYAAAGHEILDIQWGTWTGRLPTQQITYQDVVISRATRQR